MGAALLSVLCICIGLAMIFRAVHSWRMRSSGGLSVAASTKERQDLPEPEEKFEVERLSEERTDYACGHSGWKSFQMNFWGERYPPTDEMLGKREKCPECMLEATRKVSIRCVLCGFIIFPGDPVASYGGGSGFRKSIATKAPDGSYLGCLRMSCCPSGGFFSGHWDGEKFAPAFASGMSAAEEAFATGKPVYVSDTSDPKKKK